MLILPTGIPFEAVFLLEFQQANFLYSVVLQEEMPIHLVQDCLPLVVEVAEAALHPKLAPSVVVEVVAEGLT